MPIVEGHIAEGQGETLLPWKNLIEMLETSVLRVPDKPALHSPNESDGYDVWTYERLWTDIRRIAYQLSEEGIGRHDKVGLLANGRAWWPISDFAIMSLGACTVPIYPSIPSHQIAHIVRDSGMKGLILEDAGQLRKVLDIPVDEIPDLAFVVVLQRPSDEASESVFRQASEIYRLYYFESLLQTRPKWTTDEWKALWEDFHADQLATIVYTSGTTGLPKGVLLTHGNLMANVAGIHSQFPFHDTDRTLSYLPLSHIFERTAGQFVPLEAGGTIVYARSFTDVAEDLLRMPPTVMTTVPRLLEKVIEGVKKKVAGGSHLKQRLFESSLQLAMEVRVRKIRSDSWKLRVADKMVFSAIQHALGGRMRVIISGGAPLPRYVGEFFTAIGVPVAEGYGMTETAPVISFNPPDNIRLGTAGKILENVQVKIAEDGEVLAKGPSMTQGYHQNPEATAELFTEDGWLRTGDIGEVTEDGYLCITDRKKNLIVLTTGKKVTPAPIEDDILQSPFIDQVLMLGQNRKFVSAVVVPNEEEILRWHREHGLAIAPPERWGEAEDIHAFLLAQILQHTGDYAEFERPKKVLVVREPFTVENGCLTPTLKVKAKVVREKYQEEIEALYAPAERTSMVQSH